MTETASSGDQDRITDTAAWKPGDRVASAHNSASRGTVVSVEQGHRPVSVLWDGYREPERWSAEVLRPLCPACGGSGIGGYVSREMALDAGEPSMEGMPEPCPLGCPTTRPIRELGPF